MKNSSPSHSSTRNASLECVLDQVRECFWAGGQVEYSTEHTNDNGSVARGEEGVNPQARNISSPRGHRAKQPSTAKQVYSNAQIHMKVESRKAATSSCASEDVTSVIPIPRISEHGRLSARERQAYKARCYQLYEKQHNMYSKLTSEPDRFGLRGSRVASRQQIPLSSDKVKATRRSSRSSSPVRLSTVKR
jgi:hypothetical protein